MAEPEAASAAASAPALLNVPIFNTQDPGAAVGTGDQGGLGARGGSPWLRTGQQVPAFDHDRPAKVADRPKRAVDRGREVDWAQVVLLRKEASEVITGEVQAYLSEHGRPMPAEDRLLMGRAIIRRVVNDHVRALHREGSALWSPETERTYAQVVEDSVFGYGRMQPLFEIPEAENIEIHG